MEYGVIILCLYDASLLFVKFIFFHQSLYLPQIFLILGIWLLYMYKYFIPGRCDFRVCLTWYIWDNIPGTMLLSQQTQIFANITKMYTEVSSYSHCAVSWAVRREPSPMGTHVTTRLVCIGHEQSSHIDKIITSLSSTVWIRVKTSPSSNIIPLTDLKSTSIVTLDVLAACAALWAIQSVKAT